MNVIQIIWISLLFLIAQWNPLFGQQRIKIELGKSKYNLDDVRRGDYVIKFHEIRLSSAGDELEKLGEIYMKFKDVKRNQNETIDITLKKIIVHLTKNKRHFNRNFSDNTFWSKEEQLILDKELFNNYNEMVSNIASEESRALLTYTVGIYLINQKRSVEGNRYLVEVINKYNGTEYEQRAQIEFTLQEFIQKRFGESISRAKYIIEKYPKSRSAQDATYLLARSHQLTNNHRSAVTYFDDFLLNFEDNKWAEGSKYFRAKSNFLLNNHETSIVQLENFIKDHPNSIYKPAARELIATNYSRVGRIEKTIEAFEQYKTENISAFDQIAAEKKIAVYSNMILKFPPSKDTIVYEKCKNNVRDFENKIFTIVKNNKNKTAVEGQAYIALAQFYFQNGSYDKAVKYYEILLDPKYSTLTNPTKSIDKCDSCQFLIYRPTIELDLLKAYRFNYNFDKYESLKSKLHGYSDASIGYRIRMDELNYLYLAKDSVGYLKGNMEVYLDTKAPRNVRASALFNLGNLYFSLNNYDKSIEYFDKILTEFNDESISVNAKSMIAYLKSKGK